MNVLITGVAGFIGSHLARCLLAKGYKVSGVDCFTPYYSRRQKENNIKDLAHDKNFTLKETDLRTSDLAPLLKGADIIYHMAAQAGVRASWGSEFHEYLEQNVSVTQRLLEAVKDRPIRKFIYASSSSVYGDAKKYPVFETDPVCPVSPYGVTKLAGENLALLYHKNYGVPSVCLRYFTVYGPGQRPDMAFHKFIRAALKGEKISIYGDGEQTRDFTFIADATEANVFAAEKGKNGTVYNIGGGHRVTVNHVLKTLQELLNAPLKAVYTTQEKGDVLHTFADTGKAREDLGFAPGTGLKQGLEMEVEWLKKITAKEKP